MAKKLGRFRCIDGRYANGWTPKVKVPDGNRPPARPALTPLGRVNALNSAFWGRK